MPLPISAIIPAYNAERYLEQTLESLLAQQPLAEIIIVDDGSTDETVAVVQAMQAKHSCIRLIQQQNAGQYAARMRGIREAVSEYIYCIDADDICASGAIERLYQSITAGEYVAAYGDICSVDRDGKPYGGATPNRRYPSGNVLETLLTWNFLSLGSVLVRREALLPLPDDVPIKRGSDWIMWCYVAASGVFNYASGDPVLHYRVHDANLTAQALDATPEYLGWVDVIYDTPAIIASISPETLPKLKRRSHARMYAYVGCQYLKNKHFGQARHYLTKSLYYYPFNAKRLILLFFAAACWLPSGVKQALR